MRSVLQIARGLTHTPLFTITAVVSLALGIGANAAMFSILDRVLLRTLPVPNPHELAFLYHPGPVQGSQSTEESGSPSFNYPQFRALQKETSAFVGLAGTRTQSASVSYKGDASIGSVLFVSGNYFPLLSVGAQIGRVLGEADDVSEGAHPVAVLGYAYWERRFGANPSVLNETININGKPLTIVGVVRKGFLSERTGSAPDVFVPIQMRVALTPDLVRFDSRRDYWVAMFGRLRPGVSIEQAGTALNALYRPQLEEDILQQKAPAKEFVDRYRAKVVQLRPGAYGRGGLRDESRMPALLMFGMTLLVLLIACANVANLQLARAAARTREVAVRLAIGASRWQLVRQLLTESLLIAAVGGLLGLVVGYWTLQAIISMLPAQMAASGLVTSGLDVRLVLFAAVLSFVTAVVFGLYPALHGSRGTLLGALREGSSQSTGSRGAGLFRRSLVVTQTAVSLLLLICAGLFARSLANLSSVDIGIRTDHLMTFLIAPRLNGYADERLQRFYADLTERLRALPGVTLVSAASVPAIANSSSSSSVAVEGFTPTQDGDRQANFNQVGPQYFSTLGIPLVAGREFAASDDANGPPVAIVNETFARHYFPDGQAIGKRILRGQGRAPDWVIVGVVKDSRYATLRDVPPRVFFRPYPQEQTSTLTFYVRTAIDPVRVGADIRRTVAELDPDVPIRNLRTMEEQIDSHIASDRLVATLTGTFASLATVLAAVGLYGVLAFNVARRTREIGIRIALGARVVQVRSLVLRESGLIVAIGLVLGVAAAALVGQVLRSALYELEPWDARVYVGAIIIMLAVALIAGYLPARRASSVDPLIALKAE